MAPKGQLQQVYGLHSTSIVLGYTASVLHYAPPSHDTTRHLLAGTAGKDTASARISPSTQLSDTAPRRTLQLAGSRDHVENKADHAQREAYPRHDVVPVPLGDALPTQVRARSLAVVRHALRRWHQTSSAAASSAKHPGVVTFHRESLLLYLACRNREQVHAWSSK